ncbi:MAG: hypothetical protein Q4C86_06205 [bacterium]|nr:hypothetical protein [bacterium]
MMNEITNTRQLYHGTIDVDQFRLELERLNFFGALPLYLYLEPGKSTTEFFIPLPEIWEEAEKNNGITRDMMRKGVFRLAEIETRDDFYQGEVTALIFQNEWQKLRMDFLDFFYAFFENLAKTTIFVLNAELNYKMKVLYAIQLKKTPLATKTLWGWEEKNIKNKMYEHTLWRHTIHADFDKFYDEYWNERFHGSCMDRPLKMWLAKRRPDLVLRNAIYEAGYRKETTVGNN